MRSVQVACGLCNRRWVRTWRLAAPRGVLAPLLALLGSCQAPLAGRSVGVEQLRAASPRPLRVLVRAKVSGLPLPAGIATPLTDRLSLIEIHTTRDWRRLRELAPGIGPVPDLARGPVFGLLWRCGQPLAGGWPLRLRGVRVVAGAALLEARMVGGSFLLDTTGYLSLAQVSGATYVAAVDLGSQRFYPAAGETWR